MDKQFVSTAELAKLLGISRVAVFKKIQKGEIKAVKVGHTYVISKKDLPQVLGQELSSLEKQTIEKAVKKTVYEYGETLRLLGKE